MDIPKSSGGALALKAMQSDPEIVTLIQDVGRKYPRERASALVLNAIERTLSTAGPTIEYGGFRPTGLEFFKYELSRIVDRGEE
jgi:hypothetical protein